MKASRFITFYDGVLAIIMTIIVLRFQIPSEVTWHSLMIKIPGFFCYAGSFFWLGQMWTSSYIAWQDVTQICPRTLFYMLLSLFCCSFFPFAIELVGENVLSRPAQIFYGLDVMLTTFANLLLSSAIRKDLGRPSHYFMFGMTREEFIIDFGIKVFGMLGTAFLWPPCMTIAMVISVLASIIRLFRRPDTASSGGSKEQISS